MTSNLPASSGAVRSQPRSKTPAKRACDQCKFRKIKCSLSQPCNACVSMDFECTFYQPQRKRGPTGHRVTQIRQQQTDCSKDEQCSATPVPMHQDAAYGEIAREPVQMSKNWSAGEVPPVCHGQDPTSSTAGLGLGPYVPSMDSHTAIPTWNEQTPSDIEHWLPADLGTEIPILDFPESNIYLKPSLPSMIQDPTSLAPCIPPSDPGTTSMGILQPQTNSTSIWPTTINESNMIPWINVYFDRLHPTLPLLNRSSLFTRIFSHEHRQNPQFGSMLLALCAFSLTQPIEINERPTASSRANQARLMMHEATRMRSSSEFGEYPTIEAVLTSFFLFGCLFGSNQHNAAFLRLREALDLAASLGLNNPEAYYHLPSEVTSQRLRTYLVLSITERAYALQRRHSITFWGKPGTSMRSATTHEFISNATQSLVSGVIIQHEKDAEGMVGLARLMELFDAIDESVIDCWNGRCCARVGGGGEFGFGFGTGQCTKLTREKALNVLRNLGDTNISAAASEQRHDGAGFGTGAGAGPDAGYPRTPAPLAMRLTETQRADIFITQKWLQNRIWVLCSTHGLLYRPPRGLMGCKNEGPGEQEQPELCIDYAVSIAESTLGICHSLRLSAMEAHGIGLIEKLFDIAISALDVVLYNHNVHSSSLEKPMHTHTTHSATEKPPAPEHLAYAFLVLLSSLRGGNHPFLGQYKARLRELGFGVGGNTCTYPAWE